MSDRHGRNVESETLSSDPTHPQSARRPTSGFSDYQRSLRRVNRREDEVPERPGQTLPEVAGEAPAPVRRASEEGAG